jgi:hypothetical protein
VTIGNNIYRKERIMEKRMFCLGLMLMVLSLCCSGALAASMGPPVAGSEAGKWSVGIDYAYTDMTVLIEGGYFESIDVFSPPPADNQTITVVDGKDDLECNMLFVNFGYGITDKLEVFLRLGFSDVDIPIAGGDWDAGSDFAYGLGAKATFYEAGDLRLGGLVQMTWANADGDVTMVTDEVAGVPLIGPKEFSGDGEFEWDEIKIAVGPSYKLTEGVSIYGGPFYHLISGDFDMHAVRVAADHASILAESGDFDEESDFGFYVGGQIDFSENVPFYIEWQSTGDADVVGLSIAYKY